jgi:DNA replication protein DnaC
LKCGLFGGVIRIASQQEPQRRDWVMAPLSEPERRDFWGICEDRYQVRSTILTSQLPVSRWHEQVGDPTLADGILDRLVHNAHRIEMRGDSMRKNRGKTGA